uniref:Uncharacterized protein n=1 Tax=Plectus sambesii TaxID=2011161 RepID=A0A914VYN4_9BILA
MLSEDAEGRRQGPTDAPNGHRPVTSRRVQSVESVKLLPRRSNIQSPLSSPPSYRPSNSSQSMPLKSHSCSHSPPHSLAHTPCESARFRRSPPPPPPPPRLFPAPAQQGALPPAIFTTTTTTLTGLIGRVVYVGQDERQQLGELRRHDNHEDERERGGAPEQGAQSPAPTSPAASDVEGDWRGRVGQTSLIALCRRQDEERTAGLRLNECVWSGGDSTV